MYNSNEEEKMNVWTNIWLKPREVVRYGITKDMFLFAMILMAINGISNLWNELAGSNVEGVTNYFAYLSQTERLVWSLIGGPIIGIISWFIMAGLILLIGKWLGGRGTYRAMLIALGFAAIPSLVLVAINILELLIFANGNIGIGYALWLVTRVVFALVIMVWGFVISLKAIGEAHEFSAWRALGVMAILFAALVVLAIGIALIVFILLI